MSAFTKPARSSALKATENQDNKEKKTESIRTKSTNIEYMRMIIGLGNLPAAAAGSEVRRSESE